MGSNYQFKGKILTPKHYKIKEKIIVCLLNTLLIVKNQFSTFFV